jgi:hypothetical protein
MKTATEKAAPEAKQNLIRIRFNDTETGWADQLTPDTAKIMNIPVFSDDWLLFDVVTLTGEDEHGWRRPKKLLKREFHGKAAFYYKDVEVFHKGVEVLKAAGCKVEGLISPHDGRSGIFAVVYPDGCDIMKLAKKQGFKADAKD